MTRKLIALLGLPMILVGCGEGVLITGGDDTGSLSSALEDALGEGEIWASAQDSSQLVIIHGRGSKEYVALPAPAKPHLVEFSPNGAYAYAANVGNGDMIVVRASDRQIVANLDLGLAGTHQTKPSPDGKVVFAAQIPTKRVIKIAADEANESWTVAGSLSMAGGPQCTVFTSDSKKAYVSLPVNIAVVDVASMTLLKTIPTNGGSMCGMVWSKDAQTLYVLSAGGSGHFYRVDTATDTITEAPYGGFGVDVHSFAVDPEEKNAFVSSRGTDSVSVLDLAGTAVDSISLDYRPGVADKPDMVAKKGNNVFVALRAAGVLAILRTNGGRAAYVDVAPPSANAIHGVAIRP
ncbi:MAG: YncE family protein [Myxococcales bacterium]|nr:YncE family protein [Myxococcales bacterium]